MQHVILIMLIEAYIHIRVLNGLNGLRYFQGYLYRVIVFLFVLFLKIRWGIRQWHYTVLFR